MAAEYDVKDYGALEDAAQLNNKMVTSIANFVDALVQLDLTIGDTSVFEGPLADDCYNTMKAFRSSLTETENLFKNLGAVLTETNDIYQNADNTAGGAVSGAGGGGAGTRTAQIM